MRNTFTLVVRRIIHIARDDLPCMVQKMPSLMLLGGRICVSGYSIGGMRLSICCVSGYSIGEMLPALARGTWTSAVCHDDESRVPQISVQAGLQKIHTPTKQHCGLVLLSLLPSLPPLLPPTYQAWHRTSAQWYRPLPSQAKSQAPRDYGRRQKSSWVLTI